MRILYHHRTRAGDAQGVHIGELVNAFRSLGHSVEVVSLVAGSAPHSSSLATPSIPDAQEHFAKRWARRVPFLFEVMQCGYNVAAAPWLIWRILRFQPDFLYERYSLFNCAGVLAAWLTGRPLILEVNSPLALEQHLEKEIRARRFSEWMERVICNAATKVLVVSGPLRRILIQLGVEESRLVVIPNGVNLAHFAEVGDAENLREQLGLRGRSVIGFVGWFRAWHRVDFLMDAFAAGQLGRRGASLLLVGDGPETTALREKARQLGIDGQTVFTGAVPHARIPAYLDLIDIAVQPAANEYCCPMKILEYMGLGKAIVAPRQENIEELLEEGDEALLFAPGDGPALTAALTDLVNQPQRRQSLGSAARSAIDREGLLWINNAEKVLSLVDGKTAANGPAAAGDPARTQL